MQSHKCVHESNEIVFNFKNVRTQYLTVLQNSVSLQDEFLFKFEQFIHKFVLDISNIQWKVVQSIEAFKKEQQKCIISGILDLSVLDQLEQCNTNILHFYLLAIEDLNKVCPRHHHVHITTFLLSSIVSLAHFGAVQFGLQAQVGQSVE